MLKTYNLQSSYFENNFKTIEVVGKEDPSFLYRPTHDNSNFEEYIFVNKQCYVSVLLSTFSFTNTFLLSCLFSLGLVVSF